jgi:hypothetical protein
MTYQQMLPALQSQASRIFLGDKDHMQDVLAMAYLNYQNCLSRTNRELSTAELVSFIKYRATELRNGKRPHFGNLSEKRTNDVYFRTAYLNGDIERLSLDHTEPDDDRDAYSLFAQAQVPSNENEILFRIDFEKFRCQLSAQEVRLLDLLMFGYSRPEVANMLHLEYPQVNRCLRKIGHKFTEFFRSDGNAVLSK